MNVEQLMSRNVKTCFPHDTLEIAARSMWENDCGVLPVVDLEGRPVGMITDRDICIAGYTQGVPLWEIPVSVAASKTLFSVRPTDSVQAAAEIMRTRQVRRLPVTDGEGKLVGLLSLNDLAVHSGHRAEDLPGDEIARTLSGICHHGHAASPQRAA